MSEWIDGCIAHDFNNLLTGIITSLELSQKRVADQRLDKVQGCRRFMVCPSIGR
ncbi:hypothetical protein [Pseudomonas sp. EA_5y_Pfl2_R50]|uniref:hypothetical protein n=1 Tax=Pseudomonas sp. EA_5y_Pfl2_R50 TaxID=3088691 RepID=UPI0030D8AF72